MNILNTIKNSTIYMFCFLSFFLILFSIIYSFLLHYNFAFYGYDFGIFDQLFYYLAKGDISPNVTIRQIDNLFLDHQHFGLFILAPLFSGFLGYGLTGFMLAVLSPILLIAIPGFIFYKAVMLLANQTSTFNNLSSIDKSMFKTFIFLNLIVILTLHNHIEYAISFGFHEKYLVGSVYSIICYLIVKYIINIKSNLSNKFTLLFLLLAHLYWLTIKEDQFIFVIFSWITFLIITKLSKQRKPDEKNSILLSKFNFITFILTTFSIVYGTYILPEYRKNSFLQYTGFFDPLKKGLSKLKDTGNILAFIKELNLFDKLSRVMYKDMLTIDIFGLLFNPFLLIGDYAERLLSNTASLKNYIFHYGVNTVYFSIGGLLFLSLFLILRKNFSHKILLVLLPIYSTIVIVSFVGFNIAVKSTPYRQAPELIRLSNDTGMNEVRNNIYEVKRNISPNSSLIVSDPFVTYFTARDDISTYPDLQNYDSAVKTRTIFDNFEYYILSKNDSRAKQKIIDLKIDQKYKQTLENTNFIVFKKL